METRDNQIQIPLVTVQDLWFYCQGTFQKRKCAGISRWQIGGQTFFDHALWHGYLISPTQYRTCVPCNRSMESSLLDCQGKPQRLFIFHYDLSQDIEYVPCATQWDLVVYPFCVCVLLSCLVVSDSATLWTVAHQAPLSMGFPRQEYWSGLPFPSPGDLPDPEIEPASPVSSTVKADSLPTKPSRKPETF